MPAFDPDTAVRNFHSKHQDPVPYRPFQDSDGERLGEDWHPALRLLAASDGWASYEQGAVWHCDPDEWRSVAPGWMRSESERCDVLFRTGFGDLLVWDGTFVWLISPHLSARMVVTDAIDWLVGYTFQQDDVYMNARLPALMKRARREAGPLQPDEMYNFVPALALGGSEGSSQIVRSKVREALDILLQLSEVTEYGIGSK